MKKIGLVYAMEGDLESLLQNSGACKMETIAGVPFYAIAPGIVAIAGGIGKVNIAMATQLLIQRYGPDLILNAGVAGAMEDLPVGTVVLAEQFVQHDMDTSAVGDPVGFVSTVNTVDFPCDLVELAAQLLKKMRVKHLRGKIATGDWFATDCERARWIQKTFQPMLCEMEGAAIAHVCNLNDIPFLIIRAISDSADDSAEMDYPSFERLAAENSIKLSLELISMS